ncbi:HxlR family transcriptional regulator [Acrocarpospora phusangensis]|uniref:HxlR family transcriptional regulator n=1 Tax=Acrocarpospora phusangensis TaxID=1070424 RepID=A0A919Q3S3_9ACTN|nr:helix-turn-helix domain-containing protein [Acrocarpospora phusangensis]GIH21794.1 HxlR family transcriptional regulator [Acrocarpospora phusangensis]
MRTTTLRALQDGSCSIQRSLDVIGDPWTVLILREAFLGTTRFGDFVTAIGISTDLLTDRLATLVEAGVLEKRPYSEPGRRSRFEYLVTPMGGELRVVLGALQQWGDAHRLRGAAPTIVRRSRATGERLEVAFVGESGQAVPLDDVTFVPSAAQAVSGG